MSKDALDVLLDAYEERQRAMREHKERAQRERFIPWDRVKQTLKCTPEVWARIRRLNPDHRGVKPYTRLRGLPHKRGTPINMDIVRPSEFIARYGREAYRAIPKTAFHHDGHRKYVTAMYVVASGVK